MHIPDGLSVRFEQQNSTSIKRPHLTAAQTSMKMRSLYGIYFLSKLMIRKCNNKIATLWLVIFSTWLVTCNKFVLYISPARLWPRICHFVICYSPFPSAFWSHSPEPTFLTDLESPTWPCPVYALVSKPFQSPTCFCTLHALKLHNCHQPHLLSGATLLTLDLLLSRATNLSLPLQSSRFMKSGLSML